MRRCRRPAVRQPLPMTDQPKVSCEITAAIRSERPIGRAVYSAAIGQPTAAAAWMSIPQLVVQQGCPDVLRVR